MVLDLISKKEEQVKSFNMGDKIGYALGDFGCAAFFAFVSSYLMVFYTDVLGISAAAVGTLFIVARIWDAINDPIMGALVDKVGTSKHGKFRPYVVKFGLPMVVVGILAFTAIPSLPESMKLPYAYVTYILFGMLYTAVNIPYGSLASVMSNDPDERTALSTFRNIGSIGANLLVMFFVPKVIFNAQGAVTAEGFMTCAVVLAVISSISFFLNFRLTRERIIHKVNKNKKNIGQTLKGLVKNRAFIGVALASFTMMAGMLTVSALNVFLFKDYFKAPKLTALGGMIGMLASFVIIPFAGVIVKKLGKKETSVLGALISSVTYVGMLFIPNLTAPVYIVLSFVAGLGTGLINTIIWALVGDAIDYQEYITGERNEGTVYSSYSLARKLAQAISGGIGGFALSILGYQSGVVEQSASVGVGIKNIAIGGAAIGYILTSLILIFIYNLSKKKVAEMNKVLEERRVA
ncbi:MAG: MFS transporter [Clostridium sp.]|uniref:MFS transporter n=1 Tax=Clostridium sp. TaxID=1506 RepID=UPI0025C7034C|nr:MFS transporter [Clostridium sp.]MBS4957129.1 MFS transporter [Clostridium sp.]